MPERFFRADLEIGMTRTWTREEVLIIAREAIEAYGMDAESFIDRAVRDRTLGKVAAALDRDELINQCDGCQAGRPVDGNGNHRMGDGDYPDLMTCQRYRYTVPK